MAKLKIKYRNEEILVESKLSKDEQINQAEVNVMRSKIIRGLMKPTIEAANKVSYIAPSGINLLEYLGTSVTKNEFFLIFVQVIEAIKSVEKNNFNVRNIVLDLSYSFINERTKEVHMVYQPIFTQERSSGLAPFIYNLGYYANMATQQDYNDMNALVSFALSESRISIQKIEQYIMQVYPQAYTQFNANKPVQSQMLKGDDIFYKQNEVANGGFVNNFSSAQNQNNNYSEPINVSNDFMADDAFGTTVLSGGSEETTVLSQSNVKQAVLTRNSNNEKVIINKPAFRIGKEKSYVDYFVQSNSAVSRIHADIITENNRYYIKDNNSTNGTYVNGAVIPSEQKVEIFNGDSILLANEKFDFNVER